MAVAPSKVPLLPPAVVLIGVFDWVTVPVAGACAEAREMRVTVATDGFAPAWACRMISALAEGAAVIAAVAIWPAWAASISEATRVTAPATSGAALATAATIRRAEERLL